MDQRTGDGIESGAASEPAPVDVAPRGWRPPEKSRMTLILIAGIALAAILAILFAWELPPFAGLSERTDNAYVRGQVTVISPQVSGYVTSMPVQDFTEVKAGTVLATIQTSCGTRNMSCVPRVT